MGKSLKQLWKEEWQGWRTVGQVGIFILLWFLATLFFVCKRNLENKVRQDQQMSLQERRWKQSQLEREYGLKSSGSDQSADQQASSKSGYRTSGEPVAFKKDGKLWCPVMDQEVESAEKAVGYQDVDGVRYYFCCAGCPEPFKEDPNKYISKFPKS